MIPKKIHYIWLGGKPLSSLSNICINSWREKLPDYEITEWNEKTWILMRSARRTVFLQNAGRESCTLHGGLPSPSDSLPGRRNLHGYRHAGAEIFDALTDTDFLIGKAPYGKTGTGFIGCEKNCRITKRILDFYQDEIWHSELFMIPDIIEYLFEKEHFPIRLYEKEYFSPCPYDKPFSPEDVTENTYTIHWYEGSWKLNKQVVLFLMTKHIQNPVKRTLVREKKRVGYYLRKFGLLR